MHLSKIKVVAELIIWTLLKESKRQNHEYVTVKDNERNKWDPADVDCHWVVGEFSRLQFRRSVNFSTSHSSGMICH